MEEDNEERSQRSGRIASGATYVASWMSVRRNKNHDTLLPDEGDEAAGAAHVVGVGLAQSLA